MTFSTQTLKFGEGVVQAKDTRWKTRYGKQAAAEAWWRQNVVLLGNREQGVDRSSSVEGKSTVGVCGVLNVWKGTQATLNVIWKFWSIFLSVELYGA